MTQKVTPVVEFVVETFERQLNETANQNSIKVSKVDKPTNKKALL